MKLAQHRFEASLAAALGDRQPGVRAPHSPSPSDHQDGARIKSQPDVDAS
jgi:hypothetical protein